MENIEKKLDNFADLLGIPKDVQEDIKRMSIIQARISTCLRMNKAISRKDTEEFNRMCYKHFPRFQDGSEFEKEAVPVGTINVKTKGIEDCGKMPEDAIGKISHSDTNATRIVADYIENHLDKSDGPVLFNVFIVWKCKVLQNWKYLISSSLNDGMYYELTYNGDRGEWYLDAYKKFENRVIQRRTSEDKANE